MRQKEKTKPESLIHSFDGDTFMNSGGLNKREYFAAAALQGLCSNEHAGAVDAFCKLAVKYADRLIEELNKEEKR